MFNKIEMFLNSLVAQIPPNLDKFTLSFFSNDIKKFHNEEMLIIFSKNINSSTIFIDINDNSVSSTSPNKQSFDMPAAAIKFFIQNYTKDQNHFLIENNKVQIGEEKIDEIYKDFINQLKISNFKLLSTYVNYLDLDNKIQDIQIVSKKLKI